MALQGPQLLQEISLGSSMGSSTGCSVDVCCPWASSHAAGKALLQCLEHILPTFFSDLSVYRVIALVYSHSSLSQPSVWHYFSLSLHLFAKMPPPEQWVQLCPVLGGLELPGTGCVQHQGTCTHYSPQKVYWFLLIWGIFFFFPRPLLNKKQL